MYEKNSSKKNILINNNSFSNKKNNEIQSFSTPFKNIKSSNKRNSSLIAIDYNINKEVKSYLLTEFKSKKSDINIFSKDLSTKKNQKQKLLKKNKTFLEPFSFFVISNKNNTYKNNIKQNYNSYYTKTNINKSKLNINKFNSYINTSNSTKSNESKRNITNLSNKIAQTSESFFYKNNSKENSAKKLEMHLENDKSNNSNNFDLNKIKYIDLHINQILSNIDNIKRKKIEYLLNKKYKNINKELLKNNDKPLISNYNSNNKNILFNDVNKNNNDIQYFKEKRNEKNKININYVNFKDKLDNLVHKIKIVEDNEELEELVMLLTNDELNYIINKMNKNILPLLMDKTAKNNYLPKNYQSDNDLIRSEKKIKEKEDNCTKRNGSPKSSFYNIFKENKVYNNINNQINNKYFPKIIDNNQNHSKENIINNKLSVKNEINDIKNNINNDIPKNNAINIKNYNNGINSYNNIKNKQINNNSYFKTCYKIKYKNVKEKTKNNELNIKIDIQKDDIAIKKNDRNNNYNIKANIINTNNNKTDHNRNITKIFRALKDNGDKTYGDKSNVVTKIILKEKNKEMKKETSLKEDLSFLGNSNKLNWDLISEKDKEKGLQLWKKIINSKYLPKKTKPMHKRLRSLKKVEQFKRNYFILDLPENMEINENLSKSQILESYQYINEVNERKRKYSLEIYKPININENDSNDDEDYSYKKSFNYFYDTNINKKREKKKKNKKKKNKKKDNKNINKSNYDKEISESSEDYSVESYVNQNTNANKIQNKLILQKLKTKQYPIGVKKDLYFNNYINSVKNRQSLLSFNNKKSTTFKKGSLINITKFLLEKYKLSDKGKYSSINSNIKKDLSETENNKIEEEKIIEEEKVEDKKERNKNKIDKKEEKIIINLFGLNIKVKNVKTALKNYMSKNKITLTKLYQQIETKNKLSKLIIQLEKEKKERRRKRYKHKKSVIDINNSRNILINFGNDQHENNNIINKRDINIQKEKKDKIETEKERKMRKMRLLLKFKNDIDYKIKTGEMNLSEIDTFSKFREKLDKLMNFYNINGNEAKMLDYVEDFQEEIELYEQRKKDEKRINSFINDLNEQIDFNSMKKKIIGEKFCNVVNYDSVNHINILNNI